MFLKKIIAKASCCNNLIDDEEYTDVKFSSILPKDQHIQRQEISNDELIKNQSISPEPNQIHDTQARTQMDPFFTNLSAIKLKGSPKIIDKQPYIGEDEFSMVQVQKLKEQLRLFPSNLEEELKKLENLQNQSHIAFKSNSQSELSFKHSEWSEYKSVVNALEYKEMSCLYCCNLVDNNHIKLQCNHYYCKDCLKEDLKQQSNLGSTSYVCRCNHRITPKFTNKLKGQDRIIDVLIEKLLINQLKQIYTNLKSRYQLQNCTNKYCTFFCITQDHKKVFYCPQCS